MNPSPPETTDPPAPGADAEPTLASPVRAMPADTKGPGTTVETPAAPALSTPAFPSPYANPLTPDAALQAQLDQAIAAGPGAGWTVGMALVALNPDGSRPVAQFRGDLEFYGASLLKFAAMYSAYELRKTVWDIAAELGTNTRKATLLKQVAAYLDPLIIAKAAGIKAFAAKGLANGHAVPQYAKVFDVVEFPSSGKCSVEFSKRFIKNLDEMIIPSSNPDAGECVQGSGYGYLNGALAAAGFYDDGPQLGVWLAGDFKEKGTAGKYPAYRIPARNDPDSAQAATALSLARMYTLLHDGALVGGASSAEMLERLERAAKGADQPWIARASGFALTVTHCKLGLGPLNTGTEVRSEGAILKHASGREFAVVWLNHVLGAAGFNDIADVVQNAVNGYLGATP